MYFSFFYPLRTVIVEFSSPNLFHRYILSGSDRCSFFSVISGLSFGSFKSIFRFNSKDIHIYWTNELSQVILFSKNLNLLAWIKLRLILVQFWNTSLIIRLQPQMYSSESKIYVPIHQLTYFSQYVGARYTLKTFESQCSIRQKIRVEQVELPSKDSFVASVFRDEGDPYMLFLVLSLALCLSLSNEYVHAFYSLKFCPRCCRSQWPNKFIEIIFSLEDKSRSDARKWL